MSETRTYSIVLRPEPEGGFTVLVPLLPEIVSYGEDEREALAMAKEAIELGTATFPGAPGPRQAAWRGCLEMGHRRAGPRGP